jgi:hypothetical protein
MGFLVCDYSFHFSFCSFRFFYFLDLGFLFTIFARLLPPSLLCTYTPYTLFSLPMSFFSFFMFLNFLVTLSKQQVVGYINLL